MPTFATYLHPQVFATSKPFDQIRFMGQSLPHFNEIRAKLAEELSGYPSIPPTQADFGEFYHVHQEQYLDKLQRMARDEKLTELPRLSHECTGLQYALPGYQYGLGGMFEAVNLMKAGSLARAYCFCIGGHHAYPDWGHGYCILNLIAATARYSQRQGFELVLIVDWDHHHGDGTQAIFANDPSVYCISIHSAADLYMASQRVLKQGTTTAAELAGQCNIPVLHKKLNEDFWNNLDLEGKYFRTEQCMSEFQTSLDNLPWVPSIIIILSGYDSHRDDCGKDIQDWVDRDFEMLTIYVLEIARTAGCPILSVQGGGYDISVTVPAALAHIKTLATYK